jgi:cell division protein FtsN
MEGGKMGKFAVAVGLLVACLSTSARAQMSSRPAVDPVFARAQALVSDGNGTAGRALVDSVLTATPPNAPLYPQALFWRASLASNAADAESDYRHIVVDYPLTPQAEDALLRLAQLELARGDRDGALAHLQRIPRDYPRSKSLARANYWTARVLFEKNDIVNACAANSNALAQASTDEVELRNQIQYQGQRCPAGGANSVSAKPTQADTGSHSGDVAQSTGAPRTPAGTHAAAASASPAVGAGASKVEGAAEPDVKASVAVPSGTADAKTAATDSAKSVDTRGAARSSAARTSGREPMYSVQIAAYNHKTDAEKLVGGLVKRGYEARVDGDIIPFRVRIGRYSTAAEAEEALKKMKARHMDGFVVRAPER